MASTVHPARRVLAGLSVTILTVLWACALIEPQPPRETVSARVVGEVVDWELWDGLRGRYRLEDGTVLELNVGDEPGRPSTPRLSRSDVWFETLANGDPDAAIGPLSALLLSGQMADGRTWYAAARETYRQECQFEITANRVFDVGDALVFDTGLRIVKSGTFTIRPEWQSERSDLGPAFPLEQADRVCLDSHGSASGVELFLDY